MQDSDRRLIAWQGCYYLIVLHGNFTGKWTKLSAHGQWIMEIQKYLGTWNGLFQTDQMCHTEVSHA